MNIKKDAYEKSYELARQVFSGDMTLKEAVDQLVLSRKMVSNSAKDYIYNYKSMMHGTPYKRKMNNDATIYYLEKIHEDKGDDDLNTACEAVYGHINYLEKRSGQKQKTLAKLVDELRNKLLSDNSRKYIGFNAEEKELLLYILNKPTRTTTATEIADHFNYSSPSTVNLKIVKIAEKVARYARYSPIEKEDGTLSWWPILFTGKKSDDGKFEWTLKGEIEDIIINTNSITSSYKSTFNRNLWNEHPSELPETIPEAILKPKHILVSSRVYERNPEIKEYLISKNGPICEYCGWQSDIADQNDQYYIEIHHLLPISQKGSDSIWNALLLCPNCHRKFHFSKNKEVLIDAALKRIKRLKDERTISKV